MDWSRLPDLIASGLMTWAFASVSRSCRNTESANWLSGWYFIVLHFVASFFESLPGAWGQAMVIVSLMSLLMAALLYMRASAIEPYYSNPACKAMLSIMAAAFLFFTCVLVFNTPHWMLNFSEALMCFAPLAMTLRFPSWSSPFLRWFSSILSCMLWVVLWWTRNLSNAADVALNAVLFSVYFACTIHFWYRNRKATTGAVIGIVGFALWAGVFVISPALDAFAPSIKLEGEIWNLPKYIVAVGMILLMLEDQIAHNKHLALHDALTGLPNRRLFQDRLASALESSRRTSTKTALLIVDLNNFKQVNDNYGHHTGDLLLQHIANIFNKKISNSDTVARTGGDEFAVILEPPVSRENAASLGNSLLNTLNQPTEINGHTLHVGASVGIAIFPDDARDAKSLFIQADMRMYEKKRVEDAINTAGKAAAQPEPASSPLT